MFLLLIEHQTSQHPIFIVAGAVHTAPAANTPPMRES